MSRRIDLPDEDAVRRIMSEVITAARNEGRKPTVVALARQLGMSHSTLWRHFPDIANELVAVARGTEPSTGDPAGPGRYDQLVLDHAKLKRANADLAHTLELAKAVIQRLSLDNHHLRQQLEEVSNVAPLNQKRRHGGKGLRH